jgi:tetratricopeptide (TPR) repeat protein
MQKLIEQATYYMQTMQFEEALTVCNKIISSGYYHPAINMMAAIALSKTNEFDKSNQIFNELIEKFPHNPELFYNYALLLQENKKYDLALSHYETCISLNPNHFSAMNNIGVIRLELQETDNAKLYFEKALFLQPENLDYKRNLANSCYYLRQYNECTKILTSIITAGQSEEEDFVILLDSYLKDSNLIEASRCIENATINFPNNSEILNLSGLIETDSKHYKNAVKLLEKAVKLNPENLEYNLNLLKSRSHLSCNHKQILHVLKGLSYKFKNELLFYQYSSSLCETISEFKKASKYIKTGLKIFPNDSKLLSTLAKIYSNKYKYKKSIKLLNKALQNCQSTQLKTELSYELSRVYDKSKNYKKAWSNIIKANQLNQSLLNYSELDNKYISQSNMLDKDFSINFKKTSINTPINQANPAKIVFVVGFPRSGTTLVERILSAHPEIKILEETNAINEIFMDINQLEGDSFFTKLNKLSEKQKLEYYQNYINNLTNYIDYTEGDTVVDKMPMNGNHLALIKSIFPTAKVILTIRHPIDVCLSCLMQDMLQIFSFASAAKVYDAYMNLLTNYINELNLDHFELVYENLISNTKTESTHLLKYLNLDWHPNIDHFHEIKTIVNTPSYQQVNKPIYQDSKFRYKYYFNKIKNDCEPLAKWIEHFNY